MKDLGELPDKPIETEQPSNKPISYPSITVSTKSLPEIIDYKIGDKIEMVIVCKVKGMRESLEDKNEYNVDLTIAQGEITNLIEDRKEAKRKGLDMKSYMSLKQKESNIIAKLDEEKM